jgi:hypothetical protein
MSPFADRRACVRYEVIGVLRGSLEVAEPARVLNISSSGALLETSTPIAVGSVRPMTLLIEGQSPHVKTCVRRVVEVGRKPKGSYEIGVEFVSPPEQLTASVASLIASSKRD